MATIETTLTIAGIKRTTTRYRWPEKGLPVHPVGAQCRAAISRCALDRAQGTRPGKRLYDRARQFIVIGFACGDELIQRCSHGSHVCKALVNFDDFFLSELMCAVPVTLRVETKKDLDFCERESQVLRALDGLNAIQEVITVSTHRSVSAVRFVQ
jgi:hypothetical protein